MKYAKQYLVPGNHLRLAVGQLDPQVPDRVADHIGPDQLLSNVDQRREGPDVLEARGKDPFLGQEDRGAGELAVYGAHSGEEALVTVETANLSYRYMGTSVGRATLQL